MSRFTPRILGVRRLIRPLVSWKVALALGLAFLMALASGVWASPQQSPPRQTVPTRTPTEEPLPTETPQPTEAPSTKIPPTEAPTAVAPPSTTPEGTPEATHTPKPTPTELIGPTRPPVEEVAASNDDPLYVLLEDKETLARYVPPTPTPSPTPTPLPQQLPQQLLGKIAFKSNYLGRTRIFLVDPDGGNLALLLKLWVYEAATAKERLSPDGAYYIRQAWGTNGMDLFIGPLGGGAPEKRITFVGHGKAYDPAWSPDGRHIAFASNQEGDDDLFMVEIWTPQDPLPKTFKLTQGDTWESDKHPSYSPDGRQIVYYSNRSGRDQLWIMEADGSNPRRLLALDAECWDPVWLK